MQNAVSNSPNSPNQTPDTPKAIDEPTRAKPAGTPPGRKIDATTIAEMAKLCAKMLTESESCRRLGIKPRTWFDFKSRAGRSQQFADLVEAFRADRIEQLIDRVEASSKGEGGLRFPDWRAALALLKITDQRRFGDSPAVEINVPNVQVDESKLARIARIYAQTSQAMLAEAAAPGAFPPPARVLELEPAKEA